MTKLLPDMAKDEMLEHYKEKLKAHDKWYMMSDDHRAYLQGLDELDEIRVIEDRLIRDFNISLVEIQKLREGHVA